MKTEDSDRHYDAAVSRPIAPRWPRRFRSAAVALAGLLATATASANMFPYGDGINLQDIGLVVQGDAHFGYAVASGDFNCDGLDDLASGLPHWNLGDIWDAGLVVILYGSQFGLEDIYGNSTSEWLHQNIGGIPGVPEPYDHFGAAFASGDFNGDGCDDLAV